MTPEQASKFFDEHKIKYILAQFVDIHGSAKAKAVPVEHLKMVLGDGAGFAGFALWGFGMGPQGPDYMAVGDLDSLQPIPWMPGYARMCTWGHVNGKPYSYDCRTALKAQLDKLAQKGMTLYTGIEPEFMLLKRAPDGRVVPADETDTLEKPCYDYKGLARQSEFLDRLVQSTRAVGIDVYQIDHEDANGQFETDFMYSDALTMADRYTFFRMMVSELAHRRGWFATFMPKPFRNRTGSGAHYNMSLATPDGSRNLFEDPQDPRGCGLSTLGYQFIAGILRHAPAICAVIAPTVNSYKRLVKQGSMSGFTWAPVFVCYGNNNRTNMLRIPLGGGRVECRAADISSNLYLGAAMVLAAGLEGIREGLDPGEPNVENMYLKSDAELRARGITWLPRTLDEAVDAFEADPLSKAVMGERMFRTYADFKRREWIDYHTEVSEWELKRYMKLF